QSFAPLKLALTLSLRSCRGRFDSAARVTASGMTRVRPSELPSAFIAADAEMARIVAFCRKFAREPHPVLFEGEAGTGKSRLARLLHATGDRAARPFVILDCATTAWDRLEATLFGLRRPDASPQPGKLHEARG